MNQLTKRPGLYKVTQIVGKHAHRRDFDAEEWSYAWLMIGGVAVLRLSHDNDPEATDAFDFVDFSAPVNIEYEYMD